MMWARMLAYITGTVDQELLLRNEYLATENRILRAKIKGRLLLSDSEKATLAEIAHRLGRKALAEVAAAAKPDTLLRWYRELIAKKFDGSKFRKSVGRPPVEKEIERLVVRMARENPSWGYNRIVGAMANLGHKLSDETVGNILRRHDIPPAPKRKQTTSWKEFIRTHMAVMAGTDFFTVEVLTLTGLKTYYVLFFIHLESRRICPAGVTRHPDQAWMEQMARNVTMEESGFLSNCRYLLHDRDSKYCSSFRQLLEAENVRALGFAAQESEPERPGSRISQSGTRPQPWSPPRHSARPDRAAAPTSYFSTLQAPKCAIQGTYPCYPETGVGANLHVFNFYYFGVFAFTRINTGWKR